MKIEVKSKTLNLTESTQRSIARQIEFGLNRLNTHIRKVSVRLTDINGPRGGIDKHCQLIINLDQLPDVVIEDVASDLMFAVNRAADRASRTVSRKIRQSRGFAPAVAAHY